MEEVSDEEAEWSDDGDCMQPIDFDIDFGDDWTDPIKVFDVFNVTHLTQKLSRFTLDSSDFTHQGRQEPSDNQSWWQSVEDLNSQPPSTEWIESVEELTNSVKVMSVLSQDQRDVLARTLEVGLCIEKAMTQPKPPCKVRHLKASLNLLLATVDGRHGGIFCEEVSHKLLNLFESDHTASSLKLLTLKVFQSAVENFGPLPGPHYQSLVERLVFGKETGRVKSGLAQLVDTVTFSETLQLLADLTQKLTAGPKSENKNALVPDLCSAVQMVSDALTAQEVSENRCHAFFKLMKRSGTLGHMLELLSHPESLVQTKLQSLVRKLLDLCLDKPEGLIFVVDTDLAVLNGIMRILLQQQTIVANTNSDCEELIGNNIACKLIHSVHAYYYLDNLYKLCYRNGSASDRLDLEQMEVLETLQNLVSLTFTSVGRMCVVRVLGFSKNLEVIIRFGL